MCDQISDAILDEALRQDMNSRVAIEAAAKNGGVMVFGEMTTKGWVDVPHITRDVIKQIGYTDSHYGIEWETCSVWTQITEQSPDISIGVSEGQGLHKEQGAGDQGMMFGYASNETPELMPLPVMLAHKLTRRLADARKNEELGWLRPDGKSQVSIEYDEAGRPQRADTILISTQHDPGLEHDEIKAAVIETVIKPVAKDWIDKDTKFYVVELEDMVAGVSPGRTPAKSTGRPPMPLGILPRTSWRQTWRIGVKFNWLMRSALPSRYRSTWIASAPINSPKAGSRCW